LERKTVVDPIALAFGSKGSARFKAEKKKNRRPISLFGGRETLAAENHEQPRQTLKNPKFAKKGRSLLLL
jgi:hypothetical protein